MSNGLRPSYLLGVMKKITGINPDFADQDELDEDALDAVEEFTEGQITYGELKTLIGPEAAAAIKEQQGEHDPERFFDNPESF